MPRPAKMMLSEPGIVTQFGRHQRLLDGDSQNAFVRCWIFIDRHVHRENHR